MGASTVRDWVDTRVGRSYEDPATWAPWGLCAETDPEAFFPEKGGSARAAKRVCRGCPVRRECLRYALATDQRFGVWGATTVEERASLRARASGARAR